LKEQEKIRAEHGFIGTQRLGDFACVVKENSFIRKICQTIGRPSEEEKLKLKKYPVTD